MSLFPVGADAAFAFFALFGLFFGWLFGSFGVPRAPLPSEEESIVQAHQVIWGKEETKNIAPLGL